MGVPLINIWGSCVSREIMNFTDMAKTGFYVLQNPIHTVDAKAIPIEYDDICATSNFTKRMIYFDFAKIAKAEFSKYPSDYLMIDVADCRYGWYEVKKIPGSKVCASPSGSKTISANFSKFQVRGVGATQVRNAEWKKYVEDFCEYLLTLYPEERIIINRFKFAEYYQGEDKLEQFQTLERDKRWGEITARVEDQLMSTLKHSLILETNVDFIGNPSHHLGFNSLHYIDSVYQNQARSLEKLLNAQSAEQIWEK